MPDIATSHTTMHGSMNVKQLDFCLLKFANPVEIFKECIDTDVYCLFTYLLMLLCT